MYNCRDCGKVFKYISKLKEHRKRKTPCKLTPNPSENVMDSSENVMNSSENVIDPSNNVMNPSLLQNNQCIYCQNIFKRNDTMQKHKKKCKLKDDYIRNIEIKLGKEVKLKNDLECRFCFKLFGRNDNLNRHYKTCKQKEIYKERLEKELNGNNGNRKNQCITYNITNNINTDNSINNKLIDNSIKQITYNKEGRYLECLDPSAPTQKLLCFDGFKRESRRNNLSIDKEKLIEIINKILVEKIKDYDSLWRLFFRNVDNQEMQMIMLQKNNNATHASIFNAGNIQCINKNILYETIGTCVSTYIIELSMNNVDIVKNIKDDEECKRSFYQVIKEDSNTFNFYKKWLTEE